LARFRTNQADTMTHIRAALAAADRETATRHAHTLKGLAGNIGADALMQAAAASERALGAGESADDLLALLDTELERVLAAIDGRPLVERMAPTPSATVSSPDVLGAGLARLLRLLKEDDADAVHQLEELRAALSARVDTETIEKLSRAVAHYEFEPAVSLLLELARKAELTIDAETAFPEISS
jgi:HPt (histidine-containing phosphotransfer) domain-containing protein